MRRSLCVTVGAVLAALLAFSVGRQDAAAQEKKVRLTLAGSFPSSMAILGTGQHYFIDKVKKISGGSIEFKFFEPGALLPGSQYFDALSAGNLDSAMIGLGFFTGKEVALALYSSVPFGPEMGEYLGWMRYGGGEQLMQELTRKYNIESLLCVRSRPRPRAGSARRSSRSTTSKA